MSTVPFLLSACSQPTPGLVYNSVNQCILDKRMSSSDCEFEFKRAYREHMRVAPRYQTNADCAADFGEAQCEQDPSNRAYYVPRMTGALLPDPRRQEDERREGKSVYRISQPVYEAKDDHGGFRLANNDVVARSNGAVTVDERDFRALPNGGFTRRGGFGRVASFRAGG